MASKKKKRRHVQVAQIPMTPMIDVVFQLLIYFLVTFEPQDVMAHLEVFTPSPEEKREKPETPPGLIRIIVARDGFFINDKPVDRQKLDYFMSKFAAIDPTQTVMIMVAKDSFHRGLIQVLDICAKLSMRNLSVTSL